MQSRSALALVLATFACSSADPAAHVAADAVGGSAPAGETPSAAGSIAAGGNAVAGASSAGAAGLVADVSGPAGTEAAAGEPPVVEPALGDYGYGATATGGEDGETILVTSLADSGPGSLREALGRSGARRIEFSVSGLLHLSSDLRVNSPDVTVDGSSAPASGVTITGATFQIATQNVIVRHLRFRGIDSPNRDSISFEGNSERVLLDHLSISWSTDDSLTTAKSGNPRDITIQNSLVAEPISCMKDGARPSEDWLTPERLRDDSAVDSTCDWKFWTLRTTTHNVTLFGNVFMNSLRSMQVSPVDCGNNQDCGTQDGIEYVQNVFHHFHTPLQFVEPRPDVLGTIDVVDNVFEPVGVESIILGNARLEVFARGNGSEAELLAGGTLGTTVHSDNVFPKRDTAALKRTLAESVGASLPCRDRIDARLVEQLLAGGGRIVFDRSETESPDPECANP